ncbi:serine hydrolase, partial [Streptomyces sp. NPDC048491]|uniref:serine hydrolase domain-containing protein n=1 Tax=Streptomyces sp. NPDC048491 TaxID=3157207 RepID=UPI00344AE377
VKIRGYRVELGEIQTILTEHPNIREAFVTVHEPVPGDRRLIAYWAATAGEGKPSLETLAKHCAERLPDYMVPAAFVTMDAIPLNANGKVDRGALPVPDRGALRTGTDHVLPRTPTEKTLAAIWSEVLGVEQIGIHDRFFDLGGHSLLMIKVLAAARAAGLTVSIYRMYQHETLIDLAAAVNADTVDASSRRDAAPAVSRFASPPNPDTVRPEVVTSGTVEVPGELLAQLLRQAGGDGQEPTSEAVTQAAALLGAARQEGTSSSPGGLVEGIDAVMADNHVPGIAFAFIREGAVAAVEGHGVLAAGSHAPVTERTLFQVGSLSKHVTALGVLCLVDRGIVELDADIEDYLTSWHLDETPETPGAVTLRMLLGHRAGLAQHRGFACRPGEPVPTLLNLLEGRPPVTTPPVCRELAPGAVFRKSSTHYWVLQQVLEDATGEPFEPLMRRLVLEPLGLADTSFDQYHPYTAGLPVALGHDAHGSTLKGGWRARAHLAAAGLWTTAADAARFMVAVRDALLGTPGALVPHALARELLAGETGTFYGLGTIVDDSDDDLEFGHGGEPSGYRNMAISRLHGGTGFVVLTNADSGTAVVKHLAAELGRAHAGFGSGRLASDWRNADGRDELPAVLVPAVTECTNEEPA